MKPLKKRCHSPDGTKEDWEGDKNIVNTPTPNCQQQTHVLEEEILSRAQGFEADGFLRLPPRRPGEGLHQSLIDATYEQDEQDRRVERREKKARLREARLAASVAASAAVASGEPPGSAGIRPSTSGRMETKTSNHPRTTAEAVADGVTVGNGAAQDEPSDDEAANSGEDDDGGGRGDHADLCPVAAYDDEPWLLALPAGGTRESSTRGKSGSAAAATVAKDVPEWDRVPTAREEGRAHDVVVTGPALSGKSTLARALADSYCVTTLTIDGIIKEAMRLRNELGARVRAAIHWFTATEEVCGSGKG